MTDFKDYDEVGDADERRKDEDANPAEEMDETTGMIQVPDEADTVQVPAETDAEHGNERSQPFGGERPQQAEDGQVPLYASQQPPRYGATYGGPPTQAASYSEAIEAKTGVNSGAIVLGIIMLMVGLVPLGMGAGFSLAGMDNVFLSSRALLALLFAVVGVLLLFIAAGGMVAQVVRGRKRAVSAGDADGQRAKKG